MKKAHKKELLKKQSIRPRSKKRAAISKRTYIFLLGASLVVGGVFYLQQIQEKSKKTHETHKSSSLTLDLSNISSESIKKRILKFTKHKPIPFRDLEEKASKLQQLTSAKSLTLIRTKFDTLAVIITSHNAIAEIDFGKSRYVSDRGAIFNVSSKDKTSLPVVKGIVPHQSITLNNDMSLKVSKKNEDILRRLSLLIETSNSYGIYYKKIQYIEGRGFNVSVLNTHFTAQVGMKDFATIIKRLNKVLKDLSSRGVSKARIEMDFKGKAFIKVSSL